MEKRFYVCKHCGNMVGMIKNAGVPIICCGEPMAELTKMQAYLLFAAANRWQNLLPTP